VDIASPVHATADRWEFCSSAFALDMTADAPMTVSHPAAGRTFATFRICSLPSIYW
jgi:hypothetical protein